jgi:hypothetical protein
MSVISAIIRQGAISLVGLLAAASAMAATAPARPPAVQALVDCRKVDNGPQRLACYDKAVDGMTRAETSGDLLIIDREQRRAVRHQAFGLTLPSLSIFDHGEKTEEVDRISAKVASASEGPYGKWVIRLDDGAVWRQIDDNDLPKGAHPGSVANIRRASLGSFFMNIDGQQAIRVHRDN